MLYIKPEDIITYRETNEIYDRMSRIRDEHMPEITKQNHFLGEEDRFVRLEREEEWTKYKVYNSRWQKTMLELMTMVHDRLSIYGLFVLSDDIQLT